MKDLLCFVVVCVGGVVFMVSGLGLMWIDSKNAPLKPTEYYRSFLERVT